jgi:ribokinase
MPRPIRIAVVGSMNIDYFTRVERLPRPGETTLAGQLEIRFGGKGANQAAAASRLGARVEMIGCLGRDGMGERYLQRLQEFGIGCGGVRLVSGGTSGSAFITVDANAENTIVVAPGANSDLDERQIEAHAALIAAADCLLLQNEVPAAVNAAAMDVARSEGTPTIYNPAPWRNGSARPGGPADIVIVNETEAAGLLGFQVNSVDQLADTAGVVVTRGAASTLANIGGQLIEARPPAIVPLDTVGAGDTFAAALAVFSARAGVDSTRALCLANAAAALSTQRLGAQEAMPTVAELAKFSGVELN